MATFRDLNSKTRGNKVSELELCSGCESDVGTVQYNGFLGVQVSLNLSCHEHNFRNTQAYVLIRHTPCIGSKPPMEQASRASVSSSKTGTSLAMSISWSNSSNCPSPLEPWSFRHISGVKSKDFRCISPSRIYWIN